MNRPPQGFQPILDKRGAPQVRRFDAQRWLIDNIIRANGIDIPCAGLMDSGLLASLGPGMTN